MYASAEAGLPYARAVYLDSFISSSRTCWNDGQTWWGTLKTSLTFAAISVYLIFIRLAPPRDVTRCGLRANQGLSIVIV